MVILEGRIEVRSYQDKEGNKRTAWDVVADHVYFGDSKPSEGANSIQGEIRDGTEAQEGSEIEDDGDLPF